MKTATPPIAGTLRSDDAEHAFEVASCEVCGNGALEKVLDLGKHPLCDDLVAVGDSRVCREYPIEILFCPDCVTAHQRFQVPKKELFPKSYHYRSRFTQDVLNGMRELVDASESRISGLAGKVVLDVGCNDGSMLDFFRAKGAVTVGVEPTGAVADAENKGHRIYNAFFSPETAETILKNHGQPAVITFTNVFAHIEDLGSLIAALKRLMSPATLLVIENHYMGSVLASNQFDTFYHEHPRTYSCTSFVRIAKSLGVELRSVEFPARYAGNIRVFMGAGQKNPEAARALEKTLLAERDFLKGFANLRVNVDKWRSAKGGLIARAVAQDGAIPAKAFPGRAAILIKLLGLDGSSISAVYEKPGSMKIGHYVPGTRIPVRSDDDLFNSFNGGGKPKRILNLAWHISSEIGAYLRANGFDGEIIDVMNAKDF